MISYVTTILIAEIYPHQPLSLTVVQKDLMDFNPAVWLQLHGADCWLRFPYLFMSSTDHLDTSTTRCLPQTTVYSVAVDRWTRKKYSLAVLIYSHSVPLLKIRTSVTHFEIKEYVNCGFSHIGMRIKSFQFMCQQSPIKFQQENSSRFWSTSEKGIFVGANMSSAHEGYSSWPAWPKSLRRVSKIDYSHQATLSLACWCLTHEKLLIFKIEKWIWS